MIGNDIVDFYLARRQSNWSRKGYLEKICTPCEQQLILQAESPEQMLWNVWSRKEAAYKIYNRLSGIRGYFPLALQCEYENEIRGKVFIDGFEIHTRTELTDDYVYTMAVGDSTIWDQIRELDSLEQIKKENGIPYMVCSDSKRKFPVSITHHGRYQRVIGLLFDSQAFF